MGISVQQIVTERIIKALESGVAPWKKPWNAGSQIGPMNWASQKPYRGVNRWLLDDGQYLTFKQIQAANGNLKAGSKGQVVVFYTQLDSKTKVDKAGKPAKTWLLRYYNVFNIADTDLNPRVYTVTKPVDPVAAAEAVIAGYELPVHFVDQDKAYYAPGLDQIVVPTRNQFKSTGDLYSTVFHEMAHSTGHKTRLNRFDDTADSYNFGSASYSLEELVAELSAGALCQHTGVDGTLENSTAYIGGWVKRLQNDHNFIIKASSAAQKAVDYILKDTSQAPEPEVEV